MHRKSVYTIRSNVNNALKTTTTLGGTSTFAPITEINLFLKMTKKNWTLINFIDNVKVILGFKCTSDELTKSTTWIVNILENCKMKVQTINIFLVV